MLYFPTGFLIAVWASDRAADSRGRSLAWLSLVCGVFCSVCVHQAVAGLPLGWAPELQLLAAHGWGQAKVCWGSGGWGAGERKCLVSAQYGNVAGAVPSREGPGSWPARRRWGGDRPPVGGAPDSVLGAGWGSTTLADTPSGR